MRRSTRIMAAVDDLRRAGYRVTSEGEGHRVRAPGARYSIMLSTPRLISLARLVPRKGKK